MADPQHVAHLDGVDRLSVWLYRSGLALSALSVLAVGVDQGSASLSLPLARPFVLVGTLLAAHHIHLYDKSMRWVFGVLSWAAVALWVTTSGGLAHDAALGLTYMVLSGFGLKERLCFRIPGMRVMPLVLAASLVPLVAGWPVAGAGLTLAGGALVGVLAVSKARMPLHYDIGDKSAYQL